MNYQDQNALFRQVEGLRKTADFSSVKDEELEAGLEAIRQLEIHNFGQTRLKESKEMFQSELLLRKQKQAIFELGRMKGSIDRLGRARTVDRWILIFGAIAAATGIALVILALKP